MVLKRLVSLLQAYLHPTCSYVMTLSTLCTMALSKLSAHSYPKSVIWPSVLSNLLSWILFKCKEQFLSFCMLIDKHGKYKRHISQLFILNVQISQVHLVYSPVYCWLNKGLHFPYMLWNLFCKMLSWKPKIEWKYVVSWIECCEPYFLVSWRRKHNSMYSRIITMKSLMLFGEPGMMLRESIMWNHEHVLQVW